MPAATRNATARSRQCNPSRVRRCLRVFFRHLFSNLGLFALVVGYVLLGALLFQFLESGYELEKRSKFQQYREDCLKELWLITERLNVLYEEEWSHRVHEELRKFETNVVAAAKMEGYDGKELRDSDLQWSFSGALLYSVTVITTIGYGNLAPKTPAGKVVTMLYALFGVPLMLLCLSNLGTLLAGTFQFAYSHACCHARAKNYHQKHKEPKNDLELNYCPPCKKHNATYEEAKPVSVLPKKVVIPVVPPTPPTVYVSAASRGPKIYNRPRPPRPLTPDVRRILEECAEYSLAQVSDPAAAKVLKELQEDPEVGNTSGPDDDDDEEEEEEEEDELEDADQEKSAAAQGTPSRMPLIWRSPCSQHRPSTPPFTCSEEDSSATGPETTRVPISLVLLVLTCYICLGAAVFAAWEEWSFLDGAYFCFITLSTIGFGDLVPGKSFQRADTRNGQLQLVACCAYLLLGLVLIAMSFTLVQEEVIAKCKQIALYIGILKRTDPQ